MKAANNMHSFFIKELAVKGPNRDDSIISLEDGLNIIKGPSNTGKSYIAECIDFMFGRTEIKLDAESDYEAVKLELETTAGDITLYRHFGEPVVAVMSKNPNILSGEYGIKNAKKNISDVWLRLIGVDKPYKVIKNAQCEKGSLTWRTFCHMFLIKEQDVIGDSSIVLPEQRTSETQALSALFFLITGEDFSGKEKIERKEIQKAKQEVVTAYLMKNLMDISERKNNLETWLESQPRNPEDAIAQILADLGKVEMELSSAFARNQSVLSDLFILGEQLAECETLTKRYESLKTQLQSDIKRLVFIVEGQVLEEDLSENHTCPYCENDIPPLKEDDYIKTSKHELERLQIQLNDLDETQRELMLEEAELELRYKSTGSEKQDIERLISCELKPKAKELQESLSAYRKSIETAREIELLGELHSEQQEEYYKLHDALPSDDGFRIKEQYERSVLNAITSYVERILIECKFDDFRSVSIDPVKFDLVVNGKPKESFGKGYRAFLNTAFAIALAEYLVDYGKHAPGFLVVDSPILSLKERGEDEASDSMKSAMFKYLLEHSGNIQFIIIENEVPPGLNYQEANVIEFTKDESSGRYGLLSGVQ